MKYPENEIMDDNRVRLRFIKDLHSGNDTGVTMRMPEAYYQDRRDLVSLINKVKVVLFRKRRFRNAKKN